MSISVRRAKEKDIPKILELLTQVCNVHSQGRPDIFRNNSQKYNREELLFLIRDDTRPIFVAVDETDQVTGYGFCILITYEDNQLLVDRREMYIDDLCVDENRRGQGIGGILFEYIKKCAKEKNCYHLTLNVWACNNSAMAFYESKGMRMLKKELEVIL